jgi:hypothetical protein
MNLLLRFKHRLKSLVIKEDKLKRFKMPRSILLMRRNLILMIKMNQLQLKITTIIIQVAKRSKEGKVILT